MRFKCLALICALSLSLVACSGNDEVVEPVIPVDTTPPLSNVAESASFYDIEVPAIGPWCGFNYVDDCLEIHPFYDSTQHIILERIMLSDKPYWDVIERTEGAVVKEYPSGSLLTFTSGKTYGYYEDGAGYAFIFSTDTLPSSYVDFILRNLGGNQMGGD